ncbi:MAG: tRNA (5-methylaminomethyl-2-thiouridine)(34)-methyltransferase MnmD [Crocinitomicaceae bacterium]
MNSKVIVTEDNSSTLFLPHLNETYHSTKGAITESKHVFIKEGLFYGDLKHLRLFEMGFGTGLNAILTYAAAHQHQLNIHYDCVEAFPLTPDQYKEMNYLQQLEMESLQIIFERMHTQPTEKIAALSDHFSFRKYLQKIEELQLKEEEYDLIYFDAFGPKVQAELWEENILKKMYDTLKPQGLLVTYCAQGKFKRTLKSVGFEVQCIAGPPGKREMTRAIKPI